MKDTFSDKSQKARAAHDPISTQEVLKALESGEIVPHYQPQICLASGRMSGVEALVRWFRKDGEDKHQVFPDQFIPVVEACPTTLKAMTLSIIKSACKDMLDYAADGHDPVKLSVNMSASELSDPVHIEAVLDCVKASNLPSHLLTLEITESAPIEDMDAAIQSLVKLRKTGIKIALDDLCTGHSKFEHVRSLPCDFIKIDKSYVDEMEIGYTQTKLLLTIGIAHGMKKRVVVEGIETQDQSYAFRIMGADHGQGWHYAKAMSIRDLMNHGLSAPLRPGQGKNKCGRFLPRSKR